MANDNDNPPAPPEESSGTVPVPGVVWSAQPILSIDFSRPADFTVNGLPFSYFGLAKQKRERRKQPLRPADGYLTRSDAAQYLGVSLRWLEANATIPKHNLGRPGGKKAMWRYRKSDLDRWIASRNQDDD